jgi:Tol biopolymer transport system component
MSQRPARQTRRAFSPDGKWLAFNSSESGAFQIYVIPFPPTGTKSQVSGAGGVQPLWRRDGRELYFLAPDGKMMAVDVRLGDTFQAGTPHVGVGTTPDVIQVITDWPGLLKK